VRFSAQAAIPVHASDDLLHRQLSTEMENIGTTPSIQTIIVCNMKENFAAVARQRLKTGKKDLCNAHGLILRIYN
jgi:hypothetical protein